METKVFCPAWALVLTQHEGLEERIKSGKATPGEVTKAFKESFQLNGVEAAAIEGTLLLTDLKDFIKGQVSLDNIMTTGPAIHVAIDFGIERLRSQLAAQNVPEAEIIKQVEKRFDAVFSQFAVQHDGEKLIPVSAKDLADIVKANVHQRLAERPNADDSVMRTEVVMAGELAAAFAFLHPFIGRETLADGRQTINYNELRDWFTQQKLPDRRPSTAPAPNVFSLGVGAAARLTPGAIMEDLGRSVSHVVTGAEIALGIKDSESPALSHDAIRAAQHASGCPFAGKMFQVPGAGGDHPQVFTPDPDVKA